MCRDVAALAQCSAVAVGCDFRALVLTPLWTCAETAQRLHQRLGWLLLKWCYTPQSGCVCCAVPCSQLPGGSGNLASHCNHDALDSGV